MRYAHPSSSDRPGGGRWLAIVAVYLLSRAMGSEADPAAAHPARATAQDGGGGHASAPPGDDCAGAGQIEAAILPLAMSVDTGGAADDAAALCASLTGASDLVFRLTLLETTDLELSLEPEPGFDAILYVRLHDCQDPLAEIGCADHAAAGGCETLRLLGLPPDHYFIFIDGARAEDQGIAELVIGEILPVFPATWGQLKARVHP